MRPLPSLHRRRSPLFFYRTALLVALLATAACARRGRVGDGDDDEAPEPLPEFVIVSVENHNWSDVIISIVQGSSQPVRLGIVTGATNAVLRFPGTYIANSQVLQLLARPVGGRSLLRSERFTVQPGQQVTWTLESSLERSSLAIY